MRAAILKSSRLLLRYEDTHGKIREDVKNEIYCFKDKAAGSLACGLT